jgi:hypothetical protein
MNHIIGRNGVSRKMPLEKLWIYPFSHRINLNVAKKSITSITLTLPSPSEGEG